MAYRNSRDMEDRWEGYRWFMRGVVMGDIVVSVGRRKVADSVDHANFLNKAIRDWGRLRSGCQ